MDDIPGLIKVNFRTVTWRVRAFLGHDFTGVIKDIDGDVFYFVDGEKHREDGPAVIWLSTVKLNTWWCLNDRILRFDAWVKRTKLTPEEILLLRITYGI